MNGVAIVFTRRENSIQIRGVIVLRITVFGQTLTLNANTIRVKKPSSHQKVLSVTVLNVPTSEEMEIAREVAPKQANKRKTRDWGQVSRSFLC